VLVSAAYDPARNVTVVRGDLENRATEVYASATLSPGGYPQAERLVASVYSVAAGQNEIVIEGDLRGLWITATAAQRFPIDLGWEVFDTSEVSNAVLVH
jgi:hypothetical protein